MSEDKLVDLDNQDTSFELKQQLYSEAVDLEATSSDIAKPKSTKNINAYNRIITVVRIVCFIFFLIFTALLINEVFIEPYKTRKAIDLAKELYYQTVEYNSDTPAASPTISAKVTETVISENKTNPKDYDSIKVESSGAPVVLEDFKELLEINEDVKGWLTIPNSNIDYPVLQNPEDEEYYLTRDINREKRKAGSLFLNYKSSIERNTQNLVIHGHNVKEDYMFHRLRNFKKYIDYYKERPVITFHTLYEKAQWKIFSVFVTNGSNKTEELFDFTQSEFRDSSEFLNFVFQLKARSIYQIDTVDINEEDQLLTISTCSYELNNYRLVIVARKLREGEEAVVDVESVTKNENPLKPSSWYEEYGGEKPEIGTFEEALAAGEIEWYKPVTKENE